MKTPTLRKPKALTNNHTDQTTREAKLYNASQVLHIPSAITEEITALTKGELLKVLHAADVVPLEKLGNVNRFLAACDLAVEFSLLPTTDISKVQNILAICFTLNNQDEELEDLRAKKEI
jgi:hypothetical protein